MYSKLLAAVKAGNYVESMDRRRNERKVCRVEALLHIKGHLAMHVRTLDLSMKGIAFVSSRGFPERTVCTLRFHVYLRGRFRPVNAKVEISNSVILHSDIRTGCRFISLDEESKKTLGDFLR